jgi:thioredoxin-like negative regulator of GroEL
MSFSTLVRSRDFAAFLGKAPIAVVAFTNQRAPAAQGFEDAWATFVEHSDADVVTGVVDVERDAELAADFGVQAVPTLALFRERQLLTVMPGAVSAEVLAVLVDAARRAPLSPRPSA